MAKALGVLLTLLVAAVASVAAQVTIRVPLNPGEKVAVVTFDEDRIPIADVKRWIQLDESGYYSAPVVQFYSKCEAADIPRLERDIKKNRRIVDELDPNRYPVELAEVVSYLKRVQAFWLWQAEQQLAFLRTGELPAAEYDGTDLKGCTVRHPPNRSDACQLVVFDWHNCVSDAMRKRLGEYPQQQWKAFLDAYGIQERLESTIGD